MPFIGCGFDPGIAEIVEGDGHDPATGTADARRGFDGVTTLPGDQADCFTHIALRELPNRAGSEERTPPVDRPLAADTSLRTFDEVQQPRDLRNPLEL